MDDDLDTLRPEVREALVTVFAALPSGKAQDEWRVIRAELLRLADECATLKAQSIHPRAQLLIMLGHANERAERAEAELAALTKKCTCSRRSVSSPIGCRVCNPQLEIADLESKLATSEAELAAALKANRDCVDHFEQMQAELAALKARIAEAPIAQVRRILMWPESDVWASKIEPSCAIPKEWDNTRVRLVVSSDD